MSQKKKRKDFWWIFAIVTAVIKIFSSEDGFGTIIFGLIVGIIIWGVASVVKKVKRHNQSEVQAYQSEVRGQAAQMSHQRAQDFKVRVNRHNQASERVASSSREVSGRAQELKDLFEAGIVDRSEYLERMAEIEAEMR
ncbi:hypothetical protein ACS3UN_00350 [Oscillospiraceae bacterium LTW-04]|nr:hypothetical protein RBH76_10085 [Oscillospiraceae bacterium MB24-C1]